MSSAINTWDEPFLPWVESANDRRFKRILLISIIVFSILGLIIPFLPTPELVKKDLKTISPRLAQLVLEKRKLPPPPVVKPVKQKQKIKPKVKRKESKTLKPREKNKALKVSQKVSRKVAASSGLMALSDELDDLRDSFDLTEFEDQPLTNLAKTSTPDFATPSVISSSATKGSGGIKTAKLTKSTGGGALASRRTTKVKSNIAAAVKKKVVKPSASGQLIRPEYEIEQVFQKNKGAIYSIYNRALRKDPGLQGKVVIELTIAANGRVTKARILSSELNNKKLERKLIARVKLFKFKPGNSIQVTVKYPIDFLPS